MNQIAYAGEKVPLSLKHNSVWAPTIYHAHVWYMIVHLKSFNDATW